MEKTNIIVELALKGDKFDVQEITNELGIVPAQTWNRGEGIRQTGRKYKYTLWEYDIGPIYTLDIRVAVKQLEKLFLNKADKLCELKRKYNLDIYIEFVIRIAENQIPGISFEPRFIKFVNKIGAVIDIDMYVY